MAASRILSDFQKNRFPPFANRGLYITAMCRKFFIFGGLFLALCLSVPFGRSQSLSARQNPIDTNFSRRAALYQLPTNATPLAQAIAKTNPAAAQILANWQTPINFYGKVVDEGGNPIVGAKVTFDWVEIPSEDGNRATNTESDGKGLFSLTGQRGPDLGIEVSKDGYYPRKDGARYGPIGNPDFTPDSRTPVVFTIKKKGNPAKSLVSTKENYRIPSDGTPVSVNLANGEKTTGLKGNLVVQCWTNNQGKRTGDKYDWRCKLSVPGGGIVEMNDEFPFLAPDSGYKPTLEINMPADSTNWNSQADIKFYYRLLDGRYGRIKFSMIAGGQHFCTIDSVLNPSGSRNLEPPN